VRWAHSADWTVGGVTTKCKPGIANKKGQREGIGRTVHTSMMTAEKEENKSYIKGPYKARGKIDVAKNPLIEYNCKGPKKRKQAAHSGKLP